MRVTQHGDGGQQEAEQGLLLPAHRGQVSQESVHVQDRLEPLGGVGLLVVVLAGEEEELVRGPLFEQREVGAGQPQRAALRGHARGRARAGEAEKGQFQISRD